ncbi:hypothetical protein Hanom_Chr01g00032881 [Helianthus anomalus]
MVLRNPTKCELLSPYHAREEVTTVAKGMAWPTPPNMIMNGSCIKNLFHSVVDEHSGLPVPDETHTEVFITMGDMLHSYVQWPRQHLLNRDAPSKSSALRMASSHGSPCHKSSSSQYMCPEPESAPEFEPEPEPKPKLKPAFSDTDVCLALERIKLKPPRIRELFDQLQIGIGKNHYIRVNSSDGMYPRSVNENILYFEFLNMLLEGCLDVIILHWFAM